MRQEGNRHHSEAGSDDEDVVQDVGLIKDIQALGPDTGQQQVVLPGHQVGSEADARPESGRAELQSKQEERVSEEVRWSAVYGGSVYGRRQPPPCRRVFRIYSTTSARWWGATANGVSQGSTC